MIPPPDLALLDSAAKDALIRTLIERLNDLMVRLEVLEAENAALRKENAELRIKLDLPPKTPDNSSTPPSQGHKASSFERLSRLFSDLLGLEISEGALVNMLDDSKQAFGQAASLIRARLLAGTILQSDETSVRVGKRTWWTWVFHHAEDACFVIHPNPSRAVVEQFLGEHRPDFWGSDRLAAQMNWAKKDHQVCLAHLIRDAQYAIDAGDTAFAPGLRKLLSRACKIAGRRHQLADATLRAYAYKLDAELDALLRITPAHGAGNNLQGVIKGCRRHMFVFLANRAIPPTNNGSEQALRPCVIFRKVTNCFPSEWAAHLYADIRSVIETARRRTIAALQAIRLTLNGLHLPAALPPLPSG